MSLSKSQKTIEVPEGTNINDVKDEIIRALAGSEGVEFVQHEELPMGHRITAETKATWRSWGEKIDIQITPERIEISSSSTEQLFDWGKSGKTVNEIINIAQKQFDTDNLHTA